MNLFPSSFVRLASLALSIPILCMCDSYTVTVTGTSLAFGQTTSGSPTYTETLTNGDPFSISVPYSASYNSNGTFTSFYPVATYTGGSAFASGVDSITIDYYQTFTGTGSFDGTYGETIPLVLSNQWMNASGFLTVGSTALPTISLSGTAGGSSYTGTATANVTGLPSGSVTEIYSITYDFFNGAVPGASGSSPAIVTPEPAEIIPIALGLASFGLIAVRRRKK